jgi:hypothetical protein
MHQLPSGPMSYDIFFVRRDPGQAFEDALDDLEGSFENGDPGELSADDLDRWDELVPKAREILGDVDIDEEDDSSRQLVARATGVELTLIPGEIEIHVPDERAAGDDLELMSEVYELARAVEVATGLEGFDPQVGEPVSGTYDDLPTARKWSDEVDDDDDYTPGGVSVATRRADMTPDRPATGSRSGRRWWEFWKS